MEEADWFQFKSKLLKGKTRGIAGVLGMTGGRECCIELNELLALAGANGDTLKEDVDEARAELKSVLSNENHPFWGILDKDENDLIERVRAEAVEKSAAEWRALSFPRKVLKAVTIFVVPWLAIYLYFKFIF